MKVLVETVSGHDNYALSVRVWRPPHESEIQIIILHGIVSHSEWLAPIAERLVNQGIEVICPDRRGTGLNTERSGDAPDLNALLEDIDCIRAQFRRPRTDCHLCGFCWGGTYAISYINNNPNAFESLILIAPSVFIAQDIADQEIVTGDDGNDTEPPLVPLDRFTSGPDYQNYILPDPLKTRAVSKRFNSILMQMAGMLGPRWARIQIPNLVILAQNDRLSDNTKTEKAFNILRSNRKELKVVAGEHGLQFDAPEETTNIVLEWIKSFKDR